ncbi:TonB-linked outer membrane protein, SusC/RagA family [Fodinibius roseus]|uniref:TonB-linked outer membrane protein, SusC/RagA family n=1 Tax=Fodinibius roseus TaxID=1194090 RepID=A0A1M5ANT1_9BACT|nr:SusC/RagA family TonB-linked outer membrane protein [Fodinibius roseus]SHF31562.1 TonB-linked outer membrane protein, SusC/RagA family [Fodinibius roseus]
MFRTLLSTFCLIAFFAQVAFAQTGSITGQVIDNNGESVPGANVLLVESGQGTATNAEGNYTISSVEAGTYTLRVTFVGFAEYNQQVTIESGETAEVNVTLRAGAIDLDEVVVTALGFEREVRSIGYSVQEVTGESVTDSRESNIVNALAGKIAGVQINSSSGQPGKSSRITIRGNSSMLGDNQPLFVVDGIPVSNASDGNPTENILFSGGASNRALDIDPSTIENVSVLKGASATALYGSRAANGAVIITTKSGQKDQDLRIDFNSSVGWGTAIIDGFNDEYLQGIDGYYHNGLPSDNGGYVEPGSPSDEPQIGRAWGPHKDSVSTQVLNDLGVDQIQTYDPRADFYETSQKTDNSINISGGTSQSNYFFSANRTDQSGIVPGSDLERTSLMGKFGSDLGELLNVQTSVNYINTGNQWMSEGNGPQNFLYGLNFVPINYDLTPATRQDGTQRMHTSSYNNPFWLAENNPYNSSVDRFISNSEITVDILPWLTISERIGIDTYTDSRKGRKNIGTRGVTSGMYDQKINRTQINSDFTISAQQDLNQDFSVELLLGNNINTRNYDYTLQEGTNLNIPNYFHISNANTVTGDEEIEEYRLYSFYGQTTVDYQDYVYLTLTARNDWSSTLPDDNNSYFYPSASLGFVFSDAVDFFDDSFVSFAKLRASISQVGSDADPYSLSTNYVQANPDDGVRGNINFPFQGINGYNLDFELGNPELKPEITTEYEIGADLRFFANRANVDISYYDRSTENQIFPVPMSNASGYDSYLGNAGEIRNYGVELALGLSPIQTSEFQWDIDVNFSKNTTEVVKLAEGVENIYLGGFTSPQIRIEPEKNGYGVLWGSRYQRSENGKLLINPESGFPIRAGSDGPIGNVQPDWNGNLRTTFRYKGVSLSALFDRQQGGDILNMDLYYATYYGSSENTEQRNTTYVYDGVLAEVNDNGELVSSGNPNDVEITRDRTYWQSVYGITFENFIEDGSYLKLRELSLAYTLPQSLIAKLPVRSLTIKGVGRNLWIDTDFSYGDPEGSLYGSGNAQGFYHMLAPSTRNYTVSLQVSF